MSQGTVSKLEAMKVGCARIDRSRSACLTMTLERIVILRIGAVKTQVVKIEVVKIEVVKTEAVTTEAVTTEAVTIEVVGLEAPSIGLMPRDILEIHATQTKAAAFQVTRNQIMKH